MGLIEEVQTMNIKLARKEQEEAKKRQERLKEIERIENKKNIEKEQKQYEKDILKAVENDLKNTFTKCFDNEGLERGFINLRLKETREEILKNISENTTEYDWLNNNYEKVLNQVKKIYENDIKAKQELYILRNIDKIEEQQKKAKKEQIKTSILYAICNIIFSPITLILFILGLLIWGYFYFALPILTI